MAQHLRPWQKPALSYARTRRHPLLFMAQRLGKNRVAILTIRDYVPRNRRLHVLVVAPRSALDSWEDELAKLGEHDVARLDGTRDERLSTLKGRHRWNLINKEGWRVVPEIGGATACEACGGSARVDDIPCYACKKLGYVPGDFDPEWDAVVWDESFWIKNPQAKVTRFFLRFFRDVPHRWAQTGTPNPESDLDFWSQIAWADGSAFRCSSYWQYRARFFRPSWDGFGWTVRDQRAAAKIRRTLSRRAFVLDRRTAGMYDEKVSQRRLVDIPARLRRAYATAESEFVLEALDGTVRAKTLFSGARWHWMRRMSAGFIGKKLVWPGKFNELRDLLCGEFARAQVVVWFAYNRELYAARRILTKAGVSCATVSGKTRGKLRSARKRRFAAGKIRVLLVQQQAENAGADFSAADTAIYFSQHPALVIRAQSEDRLLHITKRRPILLLDLLTRDTVDEVVREQLVEKRWRSQAALHRAIRDRFRGRKPA